MAEKIGITRWRVRAILRRNGIHIRGPKGGDLKSAGAESRLRALLIRPKHVTASPEREPELWHYQQHTAFVAAMRKEHPETETGMK